MITRDLTVEGITFKVAPTPLFRLAPLWKFIGADEIGGDGLRALAEAIFWGARRAGAEITLEWLEQNIDVHNSDEVHRVFAELNHVKRKKDGTAGEAQAGSDPR